MAEFLAHQNADWDEAESVQADLVFKMILLVNIDCSHVTNI